MYFLGNVGCWVLGVGMLDVGVLWDGAGMELEVDRISSAWMD
jgi:hypothetical protein